MSEKTEEATPKKLRKAREDGNVAKSAEFTGLMVLLAALAATVITIETIASRLIALYLEAIRLGQRPDLDASHIGPFLYGALESMGLMLAPILAAAFVAAAFFSYVQIGALFTIKPLIPDASKLNPAGGLKNMFNKKKAVELVKNVLKLSLMAAIGYGVFVDQIVHLLRAPRLDLFSAASLLEGGALALSMYLIGGLIAFGVFDLLWQRHTHKKDLMMSKDEVKREYKESEGDPMVKAQREALHRQMMNEAGMRKVKEADVVVVNPTHVAVALRYRQEEARAPQVVARGKGKVAAQIKALARRHRVPVVRDITLARSLVELELDEDIPPEFYEPVAEILRFAWSLRDEGRR